MPDVVTYSDGSCCCGGEDELCCGLTGDGGEDLLATISAKTGACVGLPDEVVMVWNGPSVGYGSVGELPFGSCTFGNLILNCPNVVFEPSPIACENFELSSIFLMPTPPNEGCSCNPLLLVFDCVTSTGGSFRVTVTRP